jgi:hypothetical protein
MSRRRFSLAWAVVAVILIFVVPYVVVRAGWTLDLGDRIGIVVTVAFLVSLGIGAAVHAFRAEPFTE